MKIFELFGSVLIDSKDAENSISKTGDKADGMGKKLGAGIKTAVKFGLALGAGALAAGTAMFALGVKLGNTADELLDLNSITGMSTTSIQEWRKVSEVAGVSADAMTNASQKLTKSLDTMSDGTGKGAESLEKLGISLSDIESMSADERMDVLTEALAGVEDKTERAKIGTDLFGGSWSEIAPIVDLGTSAMNEAKDAANIISEDDLAKANEFRIKVADMKDQLGFFVTKITIAVMPILHTMMDWFSGKMPLIQSVSEIAFKAIGDAITKVSDFINNSVMPVLMDLWAWIEPKLPAIKKAFETAFKAIKVVMDKVVDVVKFFASNLNILLPIILGVTAAVVAQMTINALVTAYKAWQTVTKTQTALQWLLNVALNANPLGLVAIAIGAVIAIGVLLYKNWDTINEKTIELWNVISTKFNEIKAVAVTKITEMVSSVTGKFNDIKSSATTKFNEVKDAIMKPINSAVSLVETAIGKIKGFFTGLKLKLPTIKTPKFSLNNWSLNPVDWLKNMPSIGVKWNAKGGIFNKPTMFNTPQGMQGVGEVKGEEEAIIPLNAKNLGKIGKGIASTMPQDQGYSKQPIILQTILNGRVIAEEIHGDISGFMGGRTNLNYAMKGV